MQCICFPGQNTVEFPSKGMLRHTIWTDLGQSGQRANDVYFFRALDVFQPQACQVPEVFYCRQRPGIDVHEIAASDDRQLL